MDPRQPGARSFIPRGAPPVNGPVVPGCASMRLSVSTTTGSRFELCVPRGDTVEGLRRRLSQKLRVPKDKLVLLHKETRLSAGRLLDLGLVDGSKLTLVPAIEAGLTSHSSRTEKTMMQALESLTETQVSDFLSGRSPLTLALGVGDHMMYVQLQLASQNAVGQQQQQQQQQQRHLIARSGGKVQSGKSGPARTPHPCPYPSNGTRPSSDPLHPHTPSPASQTTPPNPQTHRPAPYPSHRPTSPASPSSVRTSVIRQHPQTPPSPAFSYPSPHITQPLPPHLSQVPTPAPALSSSFGSPPPPCSSLPPAAPVHSPRPPCSSPEPRSPPPATIFPEGVSRPASPVCSSQEPGAVIESFVSHSPGVFSGTFSGTLPPTGQGGACHPRRGISTILQILNDLLSATRHHQGAPPSLSQLRCPAPGSPSPASSPPPPTPFPSPSSSSTTEATTSEPARTQGAGPEHFSRTQNHSSKPPPADDVVRPRSSLSEENRALRCKLERLQFLMHQRRQRRRARGDTHVTPSSHPYPPLHRRHHRRRQHPQHPWSPRRGGERKAARRRSDGSLSGSESSQDDLGPKEVMEEEEESPWKPDLTGSDLVLA